MKYRMEKDVLGRVRVPSDAYYGSETQRALDNFRISGLGMQHEFIGAYVVLKRCAAIANMKAGKLDSKKGRAIVRACDEILKGRLSDQFSVDVFQAGAGTNVNMNVNEVIANRAIELLGGRKGNYKIIHPNDHVNMSQSTNDTFPTTIRISSFIESGKLLGSLGLLEKELGKKSREFNRIIKTGRTHLQDAVPMRLGQEFGGYQNEIRQVIKALEVSRAQLLRIPIGGTAVGTGINAGRAYKRFVIRELRKEINADFRASENVFADTQTRLAELDLSNSLVEISIALEKIANDLRLLGSGPNAGLSELVLPPVQPGSSIMPGKINPSVPEMLTMVCFQVMGSGTTIREAVGAGQLELNVFMPIIAYDLLFSMGILSNAVRVFSLRCVRGLKANRERLGEYLKLDLSVATALTPYIGYSKAAQIARTAYLKKKSIKQVCLEMNVLDKKTLDKILDPRRSV